MGRMKYFLPIIMALFAGLASTHLTAKGSPAIQLPQWAVRDSIRQAEIIEKKRLADSIKHVKDSLTMYYIGVPDQNRPNQLLDSLRKLVVVESGDFMGWLAFMRTLDENIETDIEKTSRERWIIVVIGLLLLFLGIVKIAFPGEVTSIIQAFYNDRVLLQIDKEDTLYSSWPFVFLYILFGFSVGLFIYQYNLYYVGDKKTHDIETFLGISFFIMLLFALKIVVTRFLGFVFDIQRVVREYISILYLSFFNAAIVFLPVIVVLSLVPQNHILWIIPATLFIVLCLFVFRFVKTANNVLAGHRFSKFYLFVYLCCLEIAPVLILIKVLGN